MRQARLITPEGTTMADWRIAQELAARCGADFGYETVEDVQDEIARVSPAHAGVDAELIRRARDGAVLPIAEFPAEIVLHAPEGSTADAPFGQGSSVSWEPIRPGTVVPAEPDAPPVTDEAPEASDVEERAEGESPEPAPELPALHVWDRVASKPAAMPPDAYSLRLVVARTLYDAGRIVSSSPSLAALAVGVALVVHPSDLERIGVNAEGDDVRVTSSRGTVTLAVLADAATAPGTAFMAFAQKGDVGPNDIVDITSAVTELRVETIR
jgi:NADH-quinone oxidoreductase subunit G